jgi:hypothetical protein
MASPIGLIPIAQFRVPNIGQEELAHFTGRLRARITQESESPQSKRLISGSRERIAVRDLSGMSILGVR